MSPRSMGSAEPMPPWQIVKERRATFAATPEQVAKRPKARDPLAQPCARRRLDRYRPSRHDRGRDPVRPQGRRNHPAPDRTDDGRRSPYRSSLNRRRRRRPRRRRGAARPMRCCSCSAPDGHWVFELEADATIPAEYVLLRPLPRRDAEPGAGAQDRRLPAPHPGRARRLAALPRRRLRRFGDGEGLFRPEDDRR